MIKMTGKAIAKAVEVLKNQGTSVSGLRVAVIGGGCSGFSYSMSFVNEAGLLDKVYEFEIADSGESEEKKKLKVVVDQASLLYLDGCEIDYLETLEASGFKFNNPNVKSTCGCGQSFQA